MAADSGNDSRTGGERRMFNRRASDAMSGGSDQDKDRDKMGRFESALAVQQAELKGHVAECALQHQFVKQALDAMAEDRKAFRKEVQDSFSSLWKVLLGCTGSGVLLLLGIIGYLVTHLPVMQSVQQFQLVPAQQGQPAQVIIQQPGPTGPQGIQGPQGPAGNSGRNGGQP